MEADIYEVELLGDSGEPRYTIGRIFFSPEKLSELGRRVTLEILDELDEREVRNAG